ncbi:hypothetical protein HD554DRAFT_2176889 [Boletus coccyginus]|nr:hypothetical protein HD554DRAFT_2176889 [Boletus coccyginus]
MTVTEKLERFPGLVKLQYRLDCKAKTAFTSLQSDEELDFFIETIRSLIVPPCLANGKVSTRLMKAVTVYFKDVALDKDTAAPTSTSNHGKAHCPSNEIGGTDVQQKHVEELQNPPESTICQGLSHQNIAYWALLIMKDEATVDVKPPSVITQGVKQRTRNMGSSSIVDQAAAAAVQGPSSAVTVQFMSPWPGPGGNLYPPFTQQMPLQPHTTPTYPPSPNLQPAVPQSLAPTPVSDGLRAPLPFIPTVMLTPTDPGIEVPNIIPWFQSLKQRMKKPPHSVKLGDLGPKLDTKGFIDISQLSCEYISTQELQDMLKIEKGTAILIFQHVDADLRAIHSGTCQ